MPAENKQARNRRRAGKKTAEKIPKPPPGELKRWQGAAFQKSEPRSWRSRK